MAEDFAVFVDGISSLQQAKDWSRKIELAAVQAINKTADRTRTRSAKQMREEVNFSAAYLNPSSGRFNVTRRASGSKLEAVLRGRDRPTSLARFATSGTVNREGVRVEVAPGVAKFLPKAFLIRLPAGSGDVQTKSNLALAIRLGPGHSFKNKKQAIKLKNGLYLLYGPSVNQVFQSVREEQVGDAETYMAQEFTRLVDL